jgi:hypothetical protein
MVTTLKRWLMTLFLLLASCGDDGASAPDAGPGPRPGVVDIQVPRPAITGEVAVETAVFWMSKAALIDDRSNEESKVKLKDRLLDLRGPVLLELPEAPPALYSGLAMDFDVPDKEFQPVPALENLPLSLQVTGKTSAGTVFVLRDTQEVKLELRASEAIDLGPNGRLVVMVRLDASQWFSGVSIPAGTAGTPVLLDGKDILKRFEENLARSASLMFMPPQAPARNP